MLINTGDFLPLSSLENKIKLNKNFPFTLKYSDGKNIISKIQRDIKNSEVYAQEFNNYFSFINDLSNTKFWIQKENNIFPMTLMDLYQAFLQFIKSGEFEDQLYNVSDISMYGPLGPFKPVALIKMINKSLADKIILYNIIKNKLPTRKFRLNINQQVAIQFGNNFCKVEDINLKQITEHGIVLSLRDDIILPEIEQSEKLRVYLSLNFLDGITGTDNMFYSDYKDDMYTIDQSNIKYYLSYNSFESNEVYFFCRFNHLKGNKDIFRLGEFVRQTEKDLSLQLV